MIQSYTTGWPTRAEALDWLSAERQALAVTEEFAYVDHEIRYDEDADEWVVRLDFAGPDAA